MSTVANNNKNKTSTNKVKSKKVNCESCKRSVTAVRSPGIECSVCKLFYHLSCANLDAEKIEFIQENSVSWLCVLCNKPSRRSSIITASPPLDSIEDLVEKLHEYKSKHEESNKKIDELTKRVEILEALLSSKAEKINLIENITEDFTERVQSLEQQSCDKTAEIQGIAGTESEDPILLSQLIGNCIDCVIETSDIDNCFFVSNKERIIVKFRNKSTKERFVRAGKKFSRANKTIDIKGASRRVFINDQLSASRKRLYYDSKQFAQKYSFKFCWIHNANILLKQHESSSPITIDSHKDLLALESKLNDADDLLSECSRSSIENEGFYDCT